MRSAAYGWKIDTIYLQANQSSGAVDCYSKLGFNKIASYTASELSDRWQDIVSNTSTLDFYLKFVIDDINKVVAKARTATIQSAVNQDEFLHLFVCMVPLKPFSMPTNMTVTLKK